MEMPDHWNREDVDQLLTNPLYVGLGRVPAIVDVDTFAGAGARFVKERGTGEYLRRVYDNLTGAREFTGHAALGSRHDFVTSRAIKLRGAATVRQGIKEMVLDIQARLQPS